MRPQRLTMQAFGPYADVQLLDFGQLGSHQLFLIHGPTGAGKSAILDAICYALYGDTSGSERSARQMRSDHADPALVTEVTLDFSLGDQIYRVTRSPDQERTKLRGEGTTQQPAKATLWNRSGCGDRDEGHVLADRSSSATDQIHTLLGFTAAEFRQVVVLPQGQFQHLLTASSQEREQVLETLFRTEQYRLMQEALSTARKELQNDVERDRSTRALLLSQSGSESVVALEETLGRHEEQLVQLHASLEALKIAKDAAQGQVENARKSLATLQEFEAAEAAVGKLESVIESNELQRAKLKRARRAVPVLETLRGRDKAQAEVVASDEAVGRAAAALEAARTAADLAKDVFAREEARKSERDGAVAEHARLTSLARWADERTNANLELAGTTSKQRTIVEALRASSESLFALDARERELGSLLQTARERSSQLGEFTSAVRQATRTRDGRSNLSLAEKAVTQRQLVKSAAEKEVQVANRDALKARAALNKLDAAWRAGQAGVLAHALESGKPCQVCGSTRHPSPAATKRSVPREEDLENQRESVRGLDALLDESKQQLRDADVALATAKAQASTLRKQLGEDADAPPRTLLAALRRAESNLTAAQAESKRLPSLEKEAAEIQKRRTADRKTLERLESERNVVVSRLVELQATIARAERELPENLRDSAALAAASQVVRDNEARLEKALADARASLDSASTALTSTPSNLESLREHATWASAQLATLTVQLQDRMAASEFPDEPALKSAEISQALMDVLEGQLREFDEHLADAKGRLSRARQTSAGLSKPDLELLERASQEAEQSYTEAVRNEERLAGLVQQYSELFARVRGIEKTLKELEARHAVVGRIAEAAEGRNPRGVPFHRFVLASLLDDVLREASQRLRLMSNTRYTLVRGSVQHDRRTTTGLDLEVFDAYTGGTRSVVTLSGGETFLASLALALGLADVVQAYAGGIRLDAVFVDEGFGSLDPESLDLALRALVDLQKGGRLVGVISHVPEMKERIPARLEVSSSRRGSSARIVVET